MSAAGCGLVAVSAFSIVFFSSSKREENANEGDAAHALSDSVLGDAVKVIVPLARVANPPSTSSLLRGVVTQLGSAAVKLVLSVYVTASLARCDPEPSQASARCAALCVLLGVKFVADTWTSDIVAAVVSLVSRGKWRVLLMFDNVLQTKGCADFWGRRYNQPVSRLLRERVFEPLRQLGVSPQYARIATFAVSGIMHAWIARVTFGAGSELTSLLFFLAHGAAASYEEDASEATGVSPRLLFPALFVALAPLYLGHFVRNLGPFLHSRPLPSYGPITPALFEPYLLRIGKFSLFEYKMTVNVQSTMHYNK